MKNLLIISILLVVLGASFNSCEKNDDLCSTAFNQNLGIIVSNYDFGNCFSDLGLLSREQVIRDQAAFEELGFLRNNTEDCQSAELPAIDFSQNTLLGFYGEGTCEVYFTREVSKNSAEKTYTYRLSTQECGSCERFGFSMNWVLIPRVEDDFSVIFIEA